MICTISCYSQVNKHSQERNYYAEAERAFQSCKYTDAGELYRAAYIIEDIDTSEEQRLSADCAYSQKNAREQKNTGNDEQAKIWYERLLSLNPNDSEARNYVMTYTNVSFKRDSVVKVESYAKTSTTYTIKVKSR